MEPGHSVTHLEDEPSDRFVPLRRTLGVTSFGLNQIVLAPGERGRIHAHERQEEVYVVLRGRLTPVVEAAEEDHPAGAVIRVAPDLRRQIVNRGPGPLALLAIGGAGPHEGRDGIAYRDWDDPDPAPPQCTPLPEDLPASELRTG